MPIQEDRHHLADRCLIERALLGAQQFLQHGQALALRSLGDLVAQPGGRCSGARAVFEAVGLGIADIGDQPQRIGEIAIAFPGEADDEVGRQREVGAGLAQPLDQTAVVVGAVAPVHGR